MLFWWSWIGCSDSSVFYKKPKIVLEMESVLAKCVEDNLIKELNDCHTPLLDWCLMKECLKQEMGKWRNGKMYFLKSKNKDSLFFVLSSCYFCAFFELAKLCSACMQNLTNLVLPLQLSLSVCDLLQSCDLSRSFLL